MRNTIPLLVSHSYSVPDFCGSDPFPWSPSYTNWTICLSHSYPVSAVVVHTICNTRAYYLFLFLWNIPYSRGFNTRTDLLTATARPATARSRKHASYGGRWPYRRKNGPQRQTRRAGTVSRPGTPIWRGIVKTWKSRHDTATNCAWTYSCTYCFTCCCAAALLCCCAAVLLCCCTVYLGCGSLCGALSLLLLYIVDAGGCVGACPTPFPNPMLVLRLCGSWPQSGPLTRCFFQYRFITSYHKDESFGRA